MWMVTDKEKYGLESDPIRIYENRMVGRQNFIMSNGDVFFIIRRKANSKKNEWAFEIFSLNDGKRGWLRFFNHAPPFEYDVDSIAKKI